MRARTVSATQFRRQCSRLLDEVEKTGAELIITKRGRPVARVVPIKRKQDRPKLGLKILGDVVGSIEPEWIHAEA